MISIGSLALLLTFPGKNFPRVFGGSFGHTQHQSVGLQTEPIMTSDAVWLLLVWQDRHRCNF